MKKIVLASILGVLAATAAAQTSSDSDTVTISGGSTKITAPDKIRAMTPSEFYRYVGSYDLSNGQSLTLFTKGLKKYAKVEDGTWHEIVATSWNTFVALDRQLKMTIDLQDDDQVSGELLMAVQPDHVAAGGAMGDHLVAVAFHR